MKMPAEIALALQDISLESTSLVKNAENKFGTYKYFSHDQLKEKVGKLMAKHGLTMVCNETDMQVKDKYMRCVYDLYLYHASGVEYGPVKRHIVVPANGPQSFGIALSYIQKYFLRDILQIPTGDEDESELSPKDILPNVSSEPKQIEVNPIDTQELLEDMKADLDACTTEGEIVEWRDLYRDQKKILNIEDQATITKLYNEKKLEVKGK